VLTKIDIERFGSFGGYSWDSSVVADGTVSEFKRLNIIYGRNYAGKTTLSRIFRSLEIGQLPDGMVRPAFRMACDGEDIDQACVGSHGLDIRVYNRDFVDDHLSFLRSRDGKISPFAIVGSKNKEIERTISELEQKLGSADEQTGLRDKHSQAQKALSDKKGELGKAEQKLEDKLRKKATGAPNGIKHNTHLYGDSNYNIRKINADIETIRSKSIEVLTDKEVEERKKTLSDAPLPEIKAKLSFRGEHQELVEKASLLLTRPVSPTEPLADLLKDSDLQAWVKQGVDHHKGKRETCAFCRNPLSTDLWDKLDAHFNKESEQLTNEIDGLVAEIETEIESCDSVLCVSEEDFYSAIRPRLAEEAKALDEALRGYISSLHSVITSLTARRKDIFSVVTLDTEIDTAPVDTAVSAINDLIDENNTKSDSLSTDQAQARLELRLNEVASFIRDIGLEAEEEAIENLKVSVASAQGEFDKVEIELSNTERQLEQALTQTQDERKGADRVNEYLGSFFGHNSLRLVAVEDPDKSGFKFEIHRGDEPAFNLSEGECSLVAFCYFIARLEDAETKGKAPIVYIDDPVSSLDNNHIFFVFSLIETVLAQPRTDGNGSKIYPYSQMFISTHNLDFLKYLKRLTVPQGGVEYFLVEGAVRGSRIELMPEHLKSYATEFNYLFKQIYKCRDEENAKTDPDCFYNFGNNLRRFMEAYLFYCFPCPANSRERDGLIRELMGGDAAPAALYLRLANEFSHLQDHPDRSMRPVDVPEIPRLAEYVLDRIRERDVHQYNALLKSIGEEPVSVP